MRWISWLLNGISRCDRLQVPFVHLLGAGGGEVGGGEHREGGVGVPGSVAADLVMIQTGLVLRGLEAILDRPADRGDRISSGTGVAGSARR